MTDATPPSIPPSAPGKGGRTVSSRTVPTDTSSIRTVVAEEPVEADFVPASHEVPEPASVGPTPLATAVEATTGWLKRVGQATSTKVSTAYQAATQTDAEDAAAAAGSPAPALPVGAADWQVGSPTTPAGQGQRPTSGPRRVRLVVSRVDPWSVMKLSLLLSFALGIIFVVATVVLWLTLDGLNVFAQINDLVTQIDGNDSANVKNVMAYFSFSKTVASAMLIGVVDVFLLTALGTIGAFLYNIVAALVGGLHVTMTDE